MRGRLSRFVAVAVAVASGLGLVAPRSALAHGFGQRYDLPVPLWLWVAGAAAAVALSFAVIGVFVRGTPGLHGYPRVNLLRWRLGRLLAHRAVRLAAKILAVGLLVLVVATGIAGFQNPTKNLAPTAIWRQRRPRRRPSHDRTMSLQFRSIRASRADRESRDHREWTVSIRRRRSPMKTVFIRRAALMLVLAVVTALAADADTGDEAGLEFVAADELRRMQSSPQRIVIVDVRTPAEFQDSRIKSAINVPLAEIERRVGEIPRQGLVVLY